MDEQKPPHTYLGFQKRQRLISLQSIDKNEVLCCRIKTFLMSVFLGKKMIFVPVLFKQENSGLL